MADWELASPVEVVFIYVHAARSFFSGARVRYNRQRCRTCCYEKVRNYSPYFRHDPVLDTALPACGGCIACSVADGYHIRHDNNPPELATISAVYVSRFDCAL